MGALVSTWNDEGRARSDAIDRLILEESRKFRKVNVLLLGTDPKIYMIVRQMNIHYGLTLNNELMHHRLTIYDNILHNAQALIRAIHDMGFKYVDHINHVNADYILDYTIQQNPSSVFSPEIAEAIHHLWHDPILPKVMERRDEFWLGENAEYFFGEIIRIGSPGYLPTDSDILQAQWGPPQVMEAHLTFGTLQLTVIEYPKRLSPTKWKHYFEDTPYVCFCASLSDYDLVLQDDNHVNPLSESLVYFESLVNSQWFLRSSIILFLTNIGRFKDKLSKVPLERYLPTYDGGADVDKAIRHIRWRFMQVNRTRRPVHVIEHRAVDTTVDALLQIIKDTGGAPDEAKKDSQRVPSCSAAMLATRLRRMLPPSRPLKSRLWGTF